MASPPATAPPAATVVAVPNPIPKTAGAAAIFMVPIPTTLFPREPATVSAVANVPIEGIWPRLCAPTVRAAGMQTVITGFGAPSHAIAAHMLATWAAAKPSDWAHWGKGDSLTTFTPFLLRPTFLTNFSNSRSRPLKSTDAPAESVLYVATSWRNISLEP